MKSKISKIFISLFTALSVVASTAFSACENSPSDSSPSGNPPNGNPPNGSTHTHEYDKGVILEPATCTEDGRKKLTCKTCGESIIITVDGGHDYGDWVTDIEPDCVHEGQQSRTCKVCKYTDTKPVEITEHNYDYWVIHDNDLHERVCKDCGAIEFSGHTPKNGRCLGCGYQDGDTGGLEYTILSDLYYLSGAGTAYKGLTEIKIPATYKGLPVIAIDEKAFDDFIWVEKITIPESVRYLYYDLADSPNPFCHLENLKEIVVDKNNEYLSSENGILYSKDKSIIYSVPFKVSSFNVAEGVKEIADGAFFNNTLLESISLPQSLTKIGKKAFKNCSRLNNVTIPQSVEIIDEYAFEGCQNLTSATFEYTYYDAESSRQHAIIRNYLKDANKAARCLTKEYVNYSFVKKYD